MNLEVADDVAELVAEGIWAHYELTGIIENENQCKLGTIGICKDKPSFTNGESFAIENTALFLKALCKVDKRELAIAVFRHWGKGEQVWLKEEYIAGWIDLCHEAEFDGWIAYMNTKIEQHLQERERSHER